jgi:hypothetical protein
MSKKVVTDLIQRIQPSTMTSIMAEVLKLPPEWQMEFALDLCRKSRSTVAEDERQRRLRVAFKNDAFKAWVVANGDKIP